MRLFRSNCGCWAYNGLLLLSMSMSMDLFSGSGRRVEIFYAGPARVVGPC